MPLVLSRLAQLSFSLPFSTVDGRAPVEPLAENMPQVKASGMNITGLIDSDSLRSRASARQHRKFFYY